MSVEAGQVEQDDREKKLQRQLAEERRLAEMMIPKKKKRLYQKIMYSKKKKAQEVIWFFNNLSIKHVFFMHTGLDKQQIYVCKIVNIFLSISFNICFVCTKEPSH